MSDSNRDALGPTASRVDFWIFVFMLVLALVGVGFSQTDAGGIWLYWFGLVVIYGVISVARAWQRAKREAPSKPVWPMIRAEVLHWIGALVAIKIIVVFELSGITDRGAASAYSLLVLALACYLAGVHFEASFMLLGIILAVIAVGLGYLDQLSVLAIVLPLALIAIWIVFKRKFAKAS